jgi:hypothetical protein
MLHKRVTLIFTRSADDRNFSVRVKVFFLDCLSDGNELRIPSAPHKMILQQKNPPTPWSDL